MSNMKSPATNTENTNETIILTPNAIAEVKRLMENEQDNDGLMLRVGVQGGGCSGLSYIMAFDKEVGEFDKVFEFDGLKVVVDSKALLYIGGTTVDFSSEILSGGFKFDNPNSARGCGCGTSFSV